MNVKAIRDIHDKRDPAQAREIMDDLLRKIEDLENEGQVDAYEDDEDQDESWR